MPAPKWPNETAEHRAAREHLLDAEDALRRHVEEVAALRRALPLGGPPPEDYAFEDARTGARPRLSELFSAPGRSLILYGFMYGPDSTSACPMCTAMIDSLNGAAPHAGRGADIAIVAKAPAAKLRAFADSRGWGNLRLLSSHGSTYNLDYGCEDESGAQFPMLNVWTQAEDGPRHFWASELFHRGPAAEGQHPRHLDMVWPLWNLLDLTPEGRGTLMPSVDTPIAAAPIAAE